MDQNTVLSRRSVRLAALELSSTEAFVLSQIDGSATLDDVADSTGVPVEKVISIARRLEELGAIERPSSGARVGTSGRYADVAPTTPRKSPPPDGAKLLQVPRRTETDVYGLKLETGDAFLLSNVDGHASVQEIADILGEDPARVIRRVEALIRAGALELGAAGKRGGARSSRKMVSAAPVSAAKSGRASQAKLRAASRVTEAPPSKARSARRPSKTMRAARSAPSTTASRADHRALPRHPVLEDAEVPPNSIPQAAAPKDDPICDLDPETIARIDVAAEAPGGRTHYAILGVPAAASAKDVSRAYFALAATLHPDRYFGKRLGPYKKKLEQAFRTASDAYEVLRSPSRRAEYDGYLGLRRKSVEMEAALAAPAAPVPPATSVPPAAPVAPVERAAPSTPVVPDPPVVAAAAAAVTLPPPAAARARTVATPAPPVTTAPTPTPAARLSQAPKISTVEPGAPANRIHSSARRIVAAAKSASWLDGAQQALAKGDAAAAANLYRLALQCAEDPASRAYAESGLNEARSMVADTYVTRARYEEKEARWPEAVASYEKALDRRPDDPAICERLANALRQEGQDLLRATRLAELASSRSPRNAGYRKTLGLVYADGGLREKAIEQFERALEIEPSDEVAGRALTALRKGR